MEIFNIGSCRICDKNCFWIYGIDGVLADLDVCSNECLGALMKKFAEDEQNESNEAVDLGMEVVTK